MPYDSNQHLYYAALAADAAYSAQLEHHYGAKAQDMRYRTDELPEHLKALARAKVDADGRWLTAMQHERKRKRA